MAQTFEKAFPLKMIRVRGSDAYAENENLGGLAHLSALFPAAFGVDDPLRIADIGANIGLSALLFDQLCTGSEIHCFEPQPETSSHLEDNLRHNSMGRNAHFVHAIGLGAKTGDACFHEASSSSASSLIADGSPFETLAQARVDVRRLDDLDIAKQRFDLIKIDVEGFEKHVLDGGPRSAARARLVVLEFNHWCLSAMALVLPTDMLAFLLNTFAAVFIYRRETARYHRIRDAHDQIGFLHQNLVVNNVDDLACTNDVEMIARLEAASAE